MTKKNRTQQMNFDYRLETQEKSSLPLADPIIRAYAFVIDLAFMVLILSVVIFLFPSLRDLGWGSYVLYNLIILISYFIYFELNYAGKTFGKRVMGIKVICDDLCPLNFQKVFIRNLLRFSVDLIPGVFGLGLVFSFFHPQNKRIGDIVAGTIVVLDESKYCCTAKFKLGAHRLPILFALTQKQIILNEEATQLGFVIARRYFKLLIGAALLAIFPAVLVCFGLNYWGYPSLSLFLFWLLKPYYDRVILLQVNRLVFNQSVSFRDLFFGLKSGFSCGLWLNLTVFRLSMIRHLTMPIFVLEPFTGASYRRRVSELKVATASSARKLLVAFSYIDLLFQCNIICLYFIFGGTFDWSYFVNIDTVYLPQQQQFCFWYLLIYIMTTGLIEVFYVCTGFTLYLNRRNTLE